MRRRRLSTHVVAAVAALVLCRVPGMARADDFSLGSLASDAGQYITAPIRWDLGDWAAAGITVAAIAGAHEFDGRVRHHFVDPNRPLDTKDRNSTRDAVPAAAIVAGTLAASLFMQSADGFHETFSMVEAGAFSAVSAEAFKFAAGRLRPYESPYPDHWRQGGSSFPSLHSTAAFAIGGVFAESGNDDYRWLRRIIGYGVGLGTSYLRVKDNAHWLSDTVAGGALGLATAQFVLNRHGDPDRRSAFQFGPADGGWTIGYHCQFR